MNRYRTEILAALATGAAKLFLVNLLYWKAPFIILAILGWGWYAWKHAPGHAARWGFRREGLRESAGWTFLLLAGASLLMILYNWQQGNSLWHPHLVPVLLLYPVWGLIQHFLTLGLAIGGLRSLYPQWPVGLLAVIAGLGFAAVHIPVWPVAAGTFLLALVYTPIFLKYRNLWPLGLAHGWLGALFYYLVLQEDPWGELLQAISAGG